MQKIIYIIALITAVVLVSCEQVEENVQIESNNYFNGKWKIMAYIDNTPITRYFELNTNSDPMSKNDSITLKDSEKGFWNFKVKAAINEVKRTFETQNSISENSSYGIGIKIFNGRVINSDSIYFEIQFEDDETPYGNTYQLKGHRIN